MESDKMSSPNQSLFKVNTKGLCLLCYKECPKTAKLGDNDAAKNLCKIFSTYVGVNFAFLSQEVKCESLNNAGIDFHVCEDCTILAEVYFLEFQEFELSRMRMNKYTQSFLSIMKSAGKVQSRVKELHRRIKFKVHTEKSSKTIKLTEVVREEIISKCSRLTRSTPRVSLSKKLEEKCPLAKADLYPVIAHTSALLGCLVTFWLVFTLALLNPDELNADSKRRKKSLPQLTYIPQSPPEALIKKSRSRSNVTKTPEIVPKKRGRPRKTKSPKMDVNIRDIKIEIEDCMLNTSFNENESPHRYFLRIEQDKTSNSMKKTAKECKSNVQPSSVSPSPKRSKIVLEQPVVSPEPELKSTKSESPKNGKNVQQWSLVAKQLAMKPGVLLERIPNPVIPPTEKVQKPTFRKEHTPKPSKTKSQAPKFLDFIKIEPGAPEERPVNRTVVPLQLCHMCPALFDSRAKVEKHRVLVHNVAKYVQCPTCHDFFCNYSQLQAHRSIMPACSLEDDAKENELQNIARPLFPYRSQIQGSIFCLYEDCYEVFSSLDDLQVHLRAHGRFECTVCPAVFGKAHDLALHELRYRFHCMKGHLPPTNLFNQWVSCTRCDFMAESEHHITGHFLQCHLGISCSPPSCQDSMNVGYPSGVSKTSTPFNNNNSYHDLDKRKRKTFDHTKSHHKNLYEYPPGRKSSKKWRS